MSRVVWIVLGVCVGLVLSAAGDSVGSSVAIGAAIGLAIGAVVSLWASRFVASLLYGLEPRDLPTLLGVAAVLAVVCTLAAALPAFRAARVDPARVLREG
mgnify:CR=1 FL=1